MTEKLDFVRIIMTKKTACFAMISIIIASCTEKDPFPLPYASFEVFTISPGIHIPVRFENRSKNDASYEWNFGDGSEISTEIAPIHTYEESGEFMVSLTAISEDNQVNTVTRAINVGERYLTGMYIININMKDGYGNPWDNDSSGPDVLMQFGPANFKSEDEIESFFVDSLDVGQFQTPIGISTHNLLRQDYKLTNEIFFILLEEVDTVQNKPVYRQMIELIFNPVIVDGESIIEIKREYGIGDLTIPFVVIDQYQFFLEFEIR